MAPENECRNEMFVQRLPSLKLHLDTDLGGDIDDLCALALVLNWPGAELIAVTTVADDQGKRAGYVRYVLGLAGRQEVPVAAGADISLDCYRTRPGLPDEATYWPEPIPPAPTSLDQALGLLARSIEQGAIIAAIGPFTNLALLEKRSPGILHRANLYLMGGYIFPPRKGFPPWANDNDYNIQVDVESAEYVITHSHPTLIPLAVTAETALRRAYLERLRRGGPLARLIARQAEAFAKEENYETKYGKTCDNLPDDLINFQHDPLACAIALGWNEGVEIASIPLKIEQSDGWLYEIIDPTGTPTRVVTKIDGDRFSEIWVDIVAGGGDKRKLRD
jgi:inosine-uridine nucleoside N-ribohydrolase